jgi:hypothetical protein
VIIRDAVTPDRTAAIFDNRVNISILPFLASDWGGE